MALKGSGTEQATGIGTDNHPAVCPSVTFYGDPVRSVFRSTFICRAIQREKASAFNWPMKTCLPGSAGLHLILLTGSPGVK